MGKDGLALGSFPPGGIRNFSAKSNTGSNGLSIHVLIFPYLEMPAIFGQFDPAVRIDFYMPAAEHVAINHYLCPSSTTQSHPDEGGGPPWYHQHYHPVLGASGQQLFTGGTYPLEGETGQRRYATTGVLTMDTPHRVRDGPDGTSHTFLVGEVSWDHNLWLGWARSTTGGSTNEYSYCCRNMRYPLNSVPLSSAAGNGNDVSFGSLHPGGANFLLSDGAVRFITDNVELRILQAYATRSEGEVVILDE